MSCGDKKSKFNHIVPVGKAMSEYAKEQVRKQNNGRLVVPNYIDNIKKGVKNDCNRENK